jgi:F-type H+-transporting ATPase subunit epsilon
MSETLPSILQLRIFTSREQLADVEVQDVTLPSLEGYVGIFPGHRPLLLALGEGELSYRAPSKQESFSVRGGYAQISPDRVLVFTEISPNEPPGTASG